MDSFPKIIVSFLPFEKTLLKNIATSDESINVFLDSLENVSRIPKLFDRWATAHRVRQKLEELAEDILDADKALSLAQTSPTSSLQLRERCFQAFLTNIGTPYELNKPYADDFERKNGEFKNTFMHTSNLSQFLQMAPMHVTMDNEDAQYWKVIAAMMLRFPEEMERWVSGMRLPFDLFSPGPYEIWKITRLYLNHLTGPNTAKLLPQLCMMEPYRSLATRLWQEKRESYKASLDRLLKLLNRPQVDGVEDSERDSDTVAGEIQKGGAADLFEPDLVRSSYLSVLNCVVGFR